MVAKAMDIVKWSSIFKYLTVMGITFAGLALIIEYAKNIKIGKKVKKNLLIRLKQFYLRSMETNFIKVKEAFNDYDYFR